MVLQILLIASGGTREGEKTKIVALRLNTRSNVKVAKLPMFDRDANKVADFVIACKLYIRIKIRKIWVEKQIQWVLMYM